MLRSKWRRFLPKRTRPVPAEAVELFQKARGIIDGLEVSNFDALDHVIDEYRQLMDEADAAQWLALLIMQAPRAAHAQAIMDEYPHGYHDRKSRLYELIDFNDTLVSTVLLLPSDKLETFSDQLKPELDNFCQRMYSKKFNDDQFEAITHGLSREIAVFKAAENAGLNPMMASRTADAFGIDMQIADVSTGRYINIDCKTSSSFHFRLKDLVHEGRIAPHDMIDAETKGWWEIVNRGHGTRARIILLRVSQDELGEIRHYRFVNEQVIVEKLRLILKQRSLSDGHFGNLMLEEYQTA